MQKAVVVFLTGFAMAMAQGQTISLPGVQILPNSGGVVSYPSTGYLLGLLPPTPSQVLGNAILALNQYAVNNNLISTVLSTAIGGVQTSIGNGQSISTPFATLPDNTVLEDGALVIPLGLLCEQTGVLAALTCHLCSIDCIYVHNKYGGQCGYANTTHTANLTNAQQNGQVCVCNDVQKTNTGYNFTNVGAQCGPIIDGGAVDSVIDIGLEEFLRSRVPTVQCAAAGLPNPNGAGCAADCSENHQYTNGVCETVNPVATYGTEIDTGFACYCNYDPATYVEVPLNITTPTGTNITSN